MGARQHGIIAPIINTRPILESVKELKDTGCEPCIRALRCQLTGMPLDDGTDAFDAPLFKAHVYALNNLGTQLKVFMPAW